ncbi:MAG: hypothetical protein ACE3JP_16270 [Ectobacillus sp.]
MESIIVTYISKQSEEIDIELFNSAAAAQVVEELYELDGMEYQWRNEAYSLEYSFDKKQWQQLGRKERLVEANIWDGCYLRLCPSQIIPLQPARPEPKPGVPKPAPFFAPQDSEPNKEYVWKLIE